MKLIRVSGFEAAERTFSQEEATQIVSSYKFSKNNRAVALFSGEYIRRNYRRDPLVLTCSSLDTANVTLNKYILIAEKYSLFEIRD